MGLGPGELVVVLLIVLVLFGGKRLPDLARSLGESLTEFRRAVGASDDARNEDSTDSPVESTDSERDD